MCPLDHDMYFNSIKVRLKQNISIKNSCSHNFNSIKVRLKLLILRILKSSIIFQFHKGTIKTNHTARALSRMSYFNSIKVRLKPNAQVMRLNSVLGFQFHKGTIKTREDYFQPEFDNLFQFHKGTIKTQCTGYFAYVCLISIP